MSGHPGVAAVLAVAGKPWAVSEPVGQCAVRKARRLLGSLALSLLACAGLAGCSEDPSLWKRVDGRWTYDGRPFDPADPASLKALDGRFARDSVHGYYRGHAAPGSHGPSFEVLGEHEARDRHAVYWGDTYRKGQEYYTIRHVRIEPIAGADPARYQVLKHGYGRDGHSAYREGQRLRGVREPASFEVLTAELSRDARRAYFQDIEIPDSDGASFAIIDPQDDAWVRDRQRAWHVRYGQPEPGEPPRREVRVLEGARAGELRPLGREYAVDGQRVWWRGVRLKDVDLGSFSVLEARSGDDSSQPDARDARGAFARGRRIAPGRP